MFKHLTYGESDDPYGRNVAEEDEDVVWESIICPVDPGHQRGGKRLSDLKVILPHSDLEDFVWTWSSDCLIQSRVLRLFREARFTGFNVQPAKARFKESSERPPVLWELCVAGSAGLAHPDSGIRVIEHCPACGLVVYSGCSNRERLIDESQWDGSDFFRVEPLGYIFVTDRVADFIRDNQISGVRLETLNELPLRSDDTY